MAALAILSVSRKIPLYHVCRHVRRLKQWRPFPDPSILRYDINISKNFVFQKKVIILPLVFHSAETLRRRADIKWEQICANVLRLQQWKLHPSIENGLRWANFFSNMGSVDQNNHCFTKIAAIFLFMNSGSCPSSVLCAHVSWWRGCTPFRYGSRLTDAMGLWPKGGSAKKIRIFCLVFKYRPDSVVWLGIELRVAVGSYSWQLSRGWYNLQPPKEIMKE